MDRNSSIPSSSFFIAFVISSIGKASPTHLPSRFAITVLIPSITAICPFSPTSISLTMLDNSAKGKSISITPTNSAPFLIALAAETTNSFVSIVIYGSVQITSPFALTASRYHGRIVGSYESSKSAWGYIIISLLGVAKYIAATPSVFCM